MDMQEAMKIIEHEPEAPEEHQIEAWQFLIDSGAIFWLSVEYQNGAQLLINMGKCRPADPKKNQTAGV